MAKSKNLQNHKIFSLKDLTRKYKIMLSLLHGVIWFFALWYINNTSWSTDVDEGVLQEINVLRSIVLPDKFKFPADFIFINVSKDQALIDDPSDYGNIAITDRNKLAEFFKILADNNNQHYFTLCDVFFEYPSAADSMLQQQVDRCSRIIFPFHLQEDSVLQPVVHVPAGLSNYQTFNGNFSRFKLVYDSMKTIPVVLHELLDKKEYHSSFFNFKSISPHYYIRPYHLFESKEYAYYNLGELLALQEMDSFYDNFLKGKFIVIGNFETDVHSTPIGSINGALILINAYLSIRHGESSFGLGWILFIIAATSFISYVMFFSKISPPEIKNMWLEVMLEGVINKYVSFFGLCFLTVLLSVFIFSIQLNISPLVVYLVFVNFVIDMYKKYQTKKLNRE